MTTGSIFAVLAYIASILLTALVGFAITGGNASQMMTAIWWVTWVFGPGCFAPMGFFVGYLRERRQRRREQSRADFEAQEEILRKREQLHQTATVRTLEPPKPREMSDEVREYLEREKHVDTQGLTDYLRETRSHQLDELKKGLENGQAGA